MPQWGAFSEVHNPTAHRFVRDYWRYLLGWQRPPRPSPLLPQKARRLLRIMARTELTRYRVWAATQLHDITCLEEARKKAV
jgi:hypothetical protein